MHYILRRRHKPVILENITTPITYNCDVLICGGGFAGISAALAAARQGKKVILLEKSFMLGGLATAGLVTIYLPLCDGIGHQVSFGIAEELFHLSIKMGAEDKYPENWLENIGTKTEKDKRFEVQFNPQLFAILAEQLLLKEKVEILYGSYAVATDVNDKRISAVIIENKSGRQAIKAKTFIDATGDCDLAHFSGVPCECFKQGNVLAAWYYSTGKNGYKLNMLGFCDIPDDQKDEKYKESHLVNRRFTGLDGEELSVMTQLSHASTLNDIIKKRENDSELFPTAIATTPQIRMTRKIIGEYTLHDTEQHKYFEDSIGMVSDWRKRGPVYEVPYRTLYSKEVKNLIVAGRCTCVTDSMWDIMRVIPCCAVTGQAAGIAATLTDDFSKIDIQMLQNRLKQNGVVLHENEL
ncbi:MAG: FAD-dependent oxidoreductase [Ruminococcaceae bacterium]|nr:FAD-dependent oxidoreductase [Oscillospiraceae bacterium]